MTAMHSYSGIKSSSQLVSADLSLFIHKLSDLTDFIEANWIQVLHSACHSWVPALKDLTHKMHNIMNDA